MKTGPHIVFVFTAAFALGAGVVLAADNSALFDPQQATLEALVDNDASPNPLADTEEGRALYAPPHDSARH